MEAREFLISAQELIQGGREVDYRNAISRAYYYAYHVCRISLTSHLQIGITPSHQRLISDLLNYPDEKVKFFGKKLRQLKIVREQADYKLNIRFSRYEASQHLRHVQNLLLDIDNWLQSFQDK